MSRHLPLASYLRVEDVERRARAAQEPLERSWWQILWLLARGQTATATADSTGYSRYWIGQIAKRYNTEGLAGMYNWQRSTSWRPPRMLTAEQQADLRQALAGSPPVGGRRAVDGAGCGLVDTWMRGCVDARGSGGPSLFNAARTTCSGCSTVRRFPIPPIPIPIPRRKPPEK